MLGTTGYCWVTTGYAGYYWVLLGVLDTAGQCWVFWVLLEEGGGFPSEHLDNHHCKKHLEPL